METFAHTLYGNVLMSTGFIIMIKLLIPVIRQGSPFYELYLLQLLICVLGLSSWVENKNLSFWINTIDAVLMFSLIFFYV